MALRSRKLVLVVGAVVLAVGSPLAFTLGSAEVGDAVSASVIAATAVAALAVPLWPSRAEPEPDGETTGGMVAKNTGPAITFGGGSAVSGVRTQSGARGPVRAENTGSAIAGGPEGHATSGVEEVG